MSPGALPSPAPNPYEDSLCQETHFPSERFFAFFSAFQGRGGVDRRSPVLTCFRGTGAPQRGGTKHFLRRGRLRGRVQRRARLVLCGLERILSPPPVLCKSVAERAPCASESQVRERGSPREPWTTSVVSPRARAGVQATAKDQGSVPKSCSAFHAAVHTRFSQDKYVGSSQRGPVRRRAPPLCSLSR